MLIRVTNLGLTSSDAADRTRYAYFEVWYIISEIVNAIHRPIEFCFTINQDSTRLASS